MKSGWKIGVWFKTLSLQSPLDIQGVMCSREQDGCGAGEAADFHVQGVCAEKPGLRLDEKAKAGRQEKCEDWFTEARKVRGNEKAVREMQETHEKQG